MRLQEKYSHLVNKQLALLATNFYNYETLSGSLKAAALCKYPIILQLTEKSISYLGLQVAVSMARAAIAEYQIEAWLHLDHGSSLEVIRQCLDAGFDSVMIDASEKPFRENLEISSQVVKMAEPYQACVEAELGFVAKLGQKNVTDGFTKPSEAKTFVEESGVHALAVSIGTVHGFYRQEPNLQLDRLHEIKENTNAALVLHGSSGISDQQLKAAVLKGISKVNLATELKDSFMSGLRNELKGTQEIDLREVFPPAIEMVKQIVVNKLEVVNNPDIIT